MRFSFVSIADLAQVEPDAIVDVLGIVKQVDDESEIISKNSSKSYIKREITLVDASNAQVRVTLWGQQAKNCTLVADQCVGFKGVKVSDFGGRSLSATFSTSMHVDPDVEEAHSLMGWYDSEAGSGRDLSSFQTHHGLAGTTAGGGREEIYKTLGQVRDENLGTSEEPDFFTTRATIVYVKHDNVSYPACLNETCNKKVVEDAGKWRCDKCGDLHDHPQYRLVPQLRCIHAVLD
jgi:replication factor A1